MSRVSHVNPKTTRGKRWLQKVGRRRRAVVCRGRGTPTSPKRPSETKNADLAIGV